MTARIPEREPGPAQVVGDDADEDADMTPRAKQADDPVSVQTTADPVVSDEVDAPVVADPVVADPAAVETAIEDLWQEFKASGDQRLRERLILHYSPLVKYVAGRVGVGLPPNIEQADLVSYGIFGLIDAIEKGRVHEGDNLLLAGFGAGMTWASAVWRWQGR